jgi:diacylglycerol kinase (ATP)
MKNEDTGFSRLVSALGFSTKGLTRALKQETAFRQEALLALVLIPAAIILGNSGLERAMLTASVLLVLIVELLNTGIEAVVDRIGDDYHDLAGYAKDVGSAAVLIALVQLVVVWVLILTD